MGLFGKRETPPRRAGKVLKASGMRVQSGNHDTIRALAAVRQEWQSDAWGYRDMIGELRFALQFRSRAVARVKYMAAQVVPGEDEPIPLDSDKGVTVSPALRKAAAEELARLPLDSGYSFLGVLDENLGITGECWLHGYEKDGQERWEALSVDEVVAGGDGVVQIRQYGSNTIVPVDEDREEMLRLWVPHPRFKILADSPMKALISTCEEVVLAGREIRAASRSRVAANGILLVPDGLTLLNALREDTDLIEDSVFMADLAATLLAPISNEGDPGSIVPAVITGNVDDLEKIRHLRLERETSADLLDKIDKGLARIARGLDIPPEIITGMAEANHWTAWQIDASTYRHHIDPAVRMIADSLTEAFLRPALLVRGFSAEEVALVQVWYDAGNITENPNRGQDAKDAYDRGAIGMDPLRRALGFNEADAPDDEEILRMVAFKIGIDPATSGLLLQTLFGKTAEPITATNVTGNKQLEQPAQKQLPAAPAGPGQAQPGTPEQATPPPSVGAQRLLRYLMADGAPADAEPEESGWIVVDGRKLTEIDRADRDRLMLAADAVLTRALEKAGARIRSKAQKLPDLKASLVDMPALEVGQFVGRDAVLAMGMNEQDLLGDALDELEGKFTRWVEASIERTVSVVLALLRVKADSKRGKKISKRLRDGMSGRVGSGWAMFRDKLMKLAERYLYDPHPNTPDDGEGMPDVIVPPQLVRGVLAHIGGVHPDTGGIDDDGTPVRADHPLGGIAQGEEVSLTLADEGAEELGFEWAYGITPIKHFEPHLALDGQRFSSWADPKLRTSPRYAWVGEIFRPGDHVGCMCDYVMTYALKEYAEIVSDELGTETANARSDRELAESDDAAGRRGTTAQLARDERERILKLRDRYIQAGKA